MVPRLLLLVLLSLVLPASHAETYCADACMKLIREGQVLQAKGEYQQAFDKFKEAGAAAPQSSLPHSSSANLLYNASRATKPENVEEYRKQAEAHARKALQLEPGDPLAQETLRVLLNGEGFVLHKPNEAASKAQDEAEVLFAQQRYDDALAKYQEGMRADPAYSGNWVGAGDCFFMQKKWAEAESLFRKATDIEPRNSQAWRFLSDALLMQKKVDAAEGALFSGIAADPSQQPNWSKLAAFRQGERLPLKQLNLTRRYSVSVGPDRQMKIGVDSQAKSDSGQPDHLFRLTLALAEGTSRAADAGAKRSAFDIELQSWKMAFEAEGQWHAGSGKGLSDPALLQMLALHKDGQLEPAILILLYKESYRPALELWLAAHPRGLKEFVDRYGLRP